ncbi:MAG: gluconate 2-dehydrogenase subunit 3 family protein [Crocinitomicaceae bacterium]
MRENNKIRKVVSVPSTFKDIEKWESNRRSFLRAALIAGAASQIAWFTSCSSELEKANEYLTAEQSTILKSVLMAIFPDDGNGPSADELNSFGYIMWVLGDNYRDPEDNQYIIDGLDWADETAREIYFKKYVDLSQKEKDAIIAQFVVLDWGGNWMSVMVTLVLESLLLDPIYGGNVDEKGWKWLDHVPGIPRPTEATRFEAFVEKYKPGLI